GIAVHDADVVERDAEPLGHDLREGRLVALTMLVTAGENFDRAGGIDAYLRRFPQPNAAAERADRLARRDAAGLDIGREADAAQLVVGGGFTLALAETGVVRDLQRLFERRVVIARVIGHDHRRLMRKLLDEIFLA